MIEFTKVIIHNFLSIGTATVELSNQGLVLIEGVNHDDPSALSNGAGKSSIVDAISWCLFGETARKLTGDGVINIKAGGGCAVTLYFKADGKEYRVTRGRKHGMYKNGVHLCQMHGPTAIGADLTLGTNALTDARIVNIIGCSVQAFNAAIYMGQEAMVDLPSQTDKSLKAILEEAVGLSKLDEALDKAADAHAGCVALLAMVEKEISVVNAKRDGLDLAIDVLEKEIKGLDDLIFDLEKEYWSQYNDQGLVVDRTEKIITIMEEELTKHEPYDPDHYSKTERAMMGPAGKAVEHARMEYLTAQRTRDEAARHLQAMRDGKACRSCGQTLDKVKPGDIEAAEADFKTKHEALGDARAKYDAAAVAEKGKSVEFHAAAKAYEAKHQNAKQLVAKIEGERRLLKAQQQALTMLTDNWKRNDGVAKRTREAKTEQLIHNNQLLLKADVQLEKFNKSKVEVQNKMDDLTKVKMALSRKGFRGELLDQITPYLNARTQYYLSTLTDGNITAEWGTVTQNSSGNYVENFHIAIKHTSGIDKLGNLSGGEKRKVRLATALALQDLVASRAVKPIKLFIADEVDDAIDAAGLELLMGLLEEKAKQVGTVLVISHNDLSDWCTNTIQVVKKDGVSTVVKP